ncbi:sigma-70 family RNA polymerase sigma factor [Brevibacillus daliensis]|uniref:sigma-70 family RNA polymerase sigma factor n=1 Tax=Brevibacillus daliensis TaxID=2892995 RepID=UPI001E4EA189|nr:sigma-70 family RNA polymerase sigma factor [Brevibacillus daliensis]
MQHNQTLASSPGIAVDDLEKIRRYQETNCQELATELLIKYESMIKMAAKKISRNCRDFYEDLYQIGQMSLLRSLQQFDPTLGFAFEPYAMKSLIGHMKNYLRDKSWYVQVPRRIKEKGARIQQVIDELTIKLERSPDVNEIAEKMEMSVEEAIEVLAGREYYQLTSLDAPLSTDEGGSTIGDLVSISGDDYGVLENQLDLQEAIQYLKEEEQKVIYSAYIEGLSQRAIANFLGISQMSVCRIQKRAVSKLRDILTSGQATRR